MCKVTFFDIIRFIFVHCIIMHRIFRLFRENLKEIVYGGLDGIVTTFAVVASFSGAMDKGGEVIYPMGVVILFGVANLFADAVSMGLGDFLSSRAEFKLFQRLWRQQQYAIKHTSSKIEDMTSEILSSHGVDTSEQKECMLFFQKHPKLWGHFLMYHKFELTETENKQAYINALTTFLSFVFFGSVPLLPYILSFMTTSHFQVSIVFTAFALLFLGFFRARVTQETMWKSLLEVFFIGSVAALFAYIVGVLLG